MKRFKKVLNKEELTALNDCDLKKLFKHAKGCIDLAKTKRENLDEYKSIISYKAIIKKEIDNRVSRDIMKQETVIKRVPKTLEELGLVESSDEEATLSVDVAEVEPVGIDSFTGK